MFKKIYIDLKSQEIGTVVTHHAPPHPSPKEELWQAGIKVI